MERSLAERVARRKWRSRADRSLSREVKRIMARTSLEDLVRRAEHLPPALRALISAYLDKGMTLEELGTLHRVSLRQVRRRMKRALELLEDPCFLLVVRFGTRLSPELQELARAYWQEESTLRSLAVRRRQTLHGLRKDLRRMRTHLLMELSKVRDVSPEMADRVLENRRCIEGV